MLPRFTTLRPNSGKTLQAAAGDARLTATAANPYTIYLEPGTYFLDEPVSLAGAAGVHIIGAGYGSTRVVATADWVADLAPGGTRGLVDLTGCSGIVLRGFEIDAGIAALGNAGGALGSIEPTGIAIDSMVGNIFLDSMFVQGLFGAIGTSTVAGAGTRIDLFNSRFFSQGLTMIPGQETWHLFSCDVRVARDDNSPSTAAPALAALYPGENSGAAQEWQIWGSHIHAENNQTVPSLDFTTMRVGPATKRVEVLGTTFHVKCANNPATDVTGAHIFHANAAGNDVFLITGCNFILETGVGLTKGHFGAYVCPLDGPVSSRFFFTGSNWLDAAGSGGVKRAPFVLSAVPSLDSFTVEFPTIQVAGGNMTAPDVPGMIVPNTQPQITRVSSDILSGTATLSGGLVHVTFVTNPTNLEGATDSSFTNANPDVNGVDTDYLVAAANKQGYFIKAATHDDSCWTRLKRLSSTTKLRLEEGYRGATLANTQAQIGSIGVAHWNGTVATPATYRVLVQPRITTETFSVTNRHASGFTITSSNGASTATVDWVLVR